MYAANGTQLGAAEALAGRGVANILIDLGSALHIADSSRYWLADSYEDRLTAGDFRGLEQAIIQRPTRGR